MAKLSIGSPTQRGLNTVQTFLRLILWLISLAVGLGWVVYYALYGPHRRRQEA